MKMMMMTTMMMMNTQRQKLHEQKPLDPQHEQTNQPANQIARTNQPTNQIERANRLANHKKLLSDHPLVLSKKFPSDEIHSLYLFFY
jgi:hypothetical protein